MKATEANKISIKQYLANRGIHPQQDKGYYGMYRSPYRQDNTPSLKVDYNLNVWHDFGTGEGGTLIDLIMKMQNFTFYEAITQLERDSDNHSFSFQGNKEESPTQPKIEITAVKPIIHPALLEYTAERAINYEILQAHCKEVHYMNNTKNYYAIGFGNDGGGWALRNRYFKGCCSPMNITTVDNGSDSCLVFEGFMDMLSYLTLKNIVSPNLDMVVLNSVVNLSKAWEFLFNHKTIHCFLDNDEAGKLALSKISELCPTSEVIDQSVFYQTHKDLNGYLCAKKLDSLQTLKPENSLPSLQVAKHQIEHPKQTTILKPKPRKLKM